ncbi:MAG: hypothetical protein ABSH48_11430 [Verrucomicrobiota bacterium]
MCERAVMNPEDDLEPDPVNQTWTSPNIVYCRARRFGMTDVVFCLVNDGHNCGFAISSGKGVFCRHPDRKKIIAQTKSLSLG